MNEIENNKPGKETSSPQEEFGTFVKSIFRGVLPASPKETDPAFETDQEAARRKGWEYRMLLPAARSVAVFRHGTCVFSESIMQPSEAESLLRVHGPVRIVSASAAITVEEIQTPCAGLLVRYHHPRMIHFASIQEATPAAAAVRAKAPSISGALLRANRDRDAAHPELIYFWNEEVGESLGPDIRLDASADPF